MADGVTHISLPLHRIRSGGQEKIKQTNKHEQCSGLTQVQKESYVTLCIPDSIYGLTLAWVTSENSAKLWNADSSWLTVAGPYPMLPRLSAPVSGVDCPCPWFHANSLLSSRPAVQSPTPLSSLVQPTLIRVTVPFPDTARFQVQESFVWFRTKTDKGIACPGGKPI